MDQGMSQNRILSAVAVCALGLSAYQGNLVSLSEAQGSSLEKDVAALQKLVEGQAKDVADAKLLAEKSAKYAQEQAKAAAALATALDEVEQKGFTFGINPESRVALLRGWREALAAAQRDVPIVPEPMPAPTPVKSTAQR